MNKTTPFIIMDFETGGRDPKLNPVTEFAAIAIDGDTLNEIARIDIFLKPYDDSLVYEQEALNITNISMEMLENKGLPFKEFMEKLNEFFKDCKIHNHVRHKPVIVGHNITFDLAFLQHLFTRSSKKLDAYLSGSIDYYGNFQPEYIDTLRLCKFSWGSDAEFTSYKLVNCVQKAELELVGAHRAMNDVIVTKDLLVSHIRKLRSSGNNIEKQVRIRDYFKF